MIRRYEDKKLKAICDTLINITSKLMLCTTAQEYVRTWGASNSRKQEQFLGVKWPKILQKIGPDYKTMFLYMW